MTTLSEPQLQLRPDLRAYQQCMDRVVSASACGRCEHLPHLAHFVAGGQPFTGCTSVHKAKTTLAWTVQSIPLSNVRWINRRRVDTYAA